MSGPQVDFVSRTLPRWERGKVSLSVDTQAPVAWALNDWECVYKGVTWHFWRTWPDWALLVHSKGICSFGRFPAVGFYFFPFMFLIFCNFACQTRPPVDEAPWNSMLSCSSRLTYAYLPMQEDFDIKRKSRDLSGSASLALWANMNQSTTQLGSKRQSQGKHLYPAINIFICCAVIVCPLRDTFFFYVLYVPVFFVVLVQVYIFFFPYRLVFTKMVFLLAAILPSGWVVCFSFLFFPLQQVFLKLYVLMVIQCVARWAFISMDTFSHITLVVTVV